MKPRSTAWPWCTLAAALSLPACAAESPLAGGPVGAEDAALIAIATAFQAGDCARVESLAAGFVASTDLRLHAVTTWYGRCRFKADDDPGAVALLSRVAYVEPAAASDPWIPTALYWLGRARLGAGDGAAAVADFTRFRERFAHDALLDDAIYYRGKAHLAAGDPALAIADFAALLALPEASELRRAGATYTTGLAFIDRAAGDPASPDLDTAFDWLERVRDDFATSIYADNAAYRQGRVRYDQGRFADAEALLEPALVAWPDSTWRPSMAWFLGRSRYELGRFASAIEALAVTIAETTSAYHDNALYYTGRSWYRLASAEDPERFERAITFFERVLAEHPDSIYADDAAYFAARAAYELEDLEAAERAFARVPASFPTSPYVDNAWHYLVLLRVARGDCPGAAEALSALSRITPPSGYLRSTEAFFAASACADVRP